MKKQYFIGLELCASLKLRFTTKFPIKWTDEPICVLGIVVTPNKEESIALNYNPVVTKIKNTLDSWASRNLSLIGKVNIVNTLGAISAYL